MTTLIPATDHATLWALITAGTVTAIWLEQTYRWAARLSAPVLALLIAMILSNTRVVPTESAAYDFVGDWLVPLAIPMLLMRANLREIARLGWRLLLAFTLASLGTLIGIAIAVPLLRGYFGSPDTEHAAGLMAASYIGGGVNFFAIKATYDIRSEVANPLLVADNFVMAGFFVVMLAIAGSKWFRARYPHPHTLDANTDAAVNLAAKHWQRKGIGLLDVAKAFTFAFVVVALAFAAGRVTKGWFGDVSQLSVGRQMLALLCTNKFVLLTGTTLALATLFSRSLADVNGSDEFGGYLLMIFLFTIGLPADLVTVLVQAPMYFVFCTIIATMNVAVPLVVGRMFRLNLEELLLAMNATLGGPPTAAAMAISAGWSRLVLPGLLTGLLGYIVGTPIGVMVIEMLRR